jgi:hypothetical protein
VVVVVLELQELTLTLVQLLLQVVALEAFGIQQPQVVQVVQEAVEEIHQRTAVDLEYQAVLALHDKGFQADQVYASTMTEKTHTTVAEAEALAAQG